MAPRQLLIGGKKVVLPAAKGAAVQAGGQTSAPAATGGAYKDESGLLRWGAPAAAAAPAPKNNQNFLIKALNILDKPGAAVRNTVFEGIDLAQGRGFSPSDLVKGIGSNRTTTEFLGEEGKDSKLPGWAKAGLGFVSDVALDPLTYVGGAGLLKGGAQKVARQLVDPEVVSKLAAKGISPEATKQAATTAISRGTARIDQNVLDTLAQVTAKAGKAPTSSKVGVYWGLGKNNRVRIPGSERLALAANDINVKARTAFLNTKAGEVISRKLGGKAGETLPGQAASIMQRMRQGDLSAFHELETMKWGDKVRNKASDELLTELDKVLKPFKGDVGTLTDVRRMLEGDVDAATRLGARTIDDKGRTLADEAHGVRTWLDDAGTRAGLPKIDNYFPRQWSQELRDELRESIRSGSKDIGPAMKRELVDGTEWMGHPLRGTPAQIRDQIETIARSVHGKDYVKVFSDDVTDVLTAYASQVARRQANIGMHDQLIARLGELKTTPKGAKKTKAAREGRTLPAFADEIGAGAKPKLSKADRAKRSTLLNKARIDDLRAKELLKQANKVQDPANAARKRAVAQELQEKAARLREQAEAIGKTPTAAPGVQGALPLAGRAVDSEIEAARSLIREVDQSVLRSAQDTTKWRSSLASIEKTINKLEDRLAKQFNRTGQMDEGLQGRINDLYAQRDNLQSRIDITDSVMASDRSVAQTLFDSASASARGATDPVTLAANIDQNAAAVLQLFPADGKSVGAIRQILGKPEELQQVLTGAARRLTDGRNVGEVVDALGTLGRLPKSNSEMLRWYDKTNQVLKQYMIFSPGFHIRNAMGGEFNNLLAGVDNSSRLEWSRIWIKSGFGRKVDRLNDTQRRIFDRVHETGVLRQTQAQDVVGSMKGGVSANPLARNFAPVKASYGVSTGVEGYLRGSLAHDVIKKGGSVDDAADQVFKFQYDYDDLSGFERGVMKRIIPFYTWTRKNLPLQLEQMAKQPGKYTAYLKAKDNLEALSDEESVVPGYFGDLGSIRMPWNIGEGQAYWSPDLPFRDVSEFVRPDEPLRGASMVIGAVTPIIKLPIERWAGKKYFTDSPFYPGHQGAPGAWNKIPGLMPALEAIGLAEKGADGYYMDQRNVYSVEQVVPVLAQLHRLAPSGEGDEYMKQRQATNVLSFFGLGVQSNTPEAQKAELKKRKKAQSAAVKKTRDLGYVE